MNQQFQILVVLYFYNLSVITLDLVWMGNETKRNETKTSESLLPERSGFCLRASHCIRMFRAQFH